MVCCLLRYVDFSTISDILTWDLFEIIILTETIILGPYLFVQYNIFANLLFIFSFFSTCQYSDLAEAERAFILEKFRQVTTSWNRITYAGVGNEEEAGKDEHRSHMIVVTDSCLPSLASGESPISGHLLINYELPAKKVCPFLFSVMTPCSHMYYTFYLRSNNPLLMIEVFKLIFPSIKVVRRFFSNAHTKLLKVTASLCAVISLCPQIANGLAYIDYEIVLSSLDLLT